VVEYLLLFVRFRSPINAFNRPVQSRDGILSVFYSSSERIVDHSFGVSRRMGTGITSPTKANPAERRMGWLTERDIGPPHRHTPSVN